MEEQPKYHINNGLKFWYLPSKGRSCWHREDGPAVEWPGGTKGWFLNGKRHRIDGPAIEWKDGSKSWWINDRRHRDDGPAIERQDGTKEWFLNGKRHRIDGPAFERSDGIKEWWINDIKILIEEVETWLKENAVDLKTPEGLMAFKLRWI